MAQNQKHIFVDIPVEGEWPTSEDLEKRNAVIDELEQLRLGEITGSGGGLGSMDFSISVAEESRARQAIDAAMLRHLPNREFTLDVSEDEQKPSSPDGVPESRSYIHDKCGESTEVDGGDFKNIACPVPGMGRTMCTACGGMFPISEFKWADSNEGIVVYYERYRARIPSIIKLMCSRQLSLVITIVGSVAGIGLGIWSGNSLGVFLGIVIGIVSSLVGAIASLIIWDVITTPLLHRALGGSRTSGASNNPSA